jgi:hypothetical protein
VKQSPSRLATVATLSLLAIALTPMACGSVDDAHELFSSTGGQGGAGGAGSGTTVSSAASPDTSSVSNGPTSTSTGPATVTSTGPSSVTTTTTGGGVCEHPICDAGPPLSNGCDPCVGMVCAEDAYCCNQYWDGQCAQKADSLCGAGCCGNGSCNPGEGCTTCEADCGACACPNGICDGEACDTCPDDCGVCPLEPTCPHTVCFVSNDPLNTTDCHDPCVDTVCAQDPSCCMNLMWDGACTGLSISLCGADPCIEAICEQMPSCCTTAWTQGCVDLALTTCSTSCNCSHSVCADGQALVVGCNPCVDQVCAMDPYCCNNGWDGICVGWASQVCGIACG